MPAPCPVVHHGHPVRSRAVHRPRPHRVAPTAVALVLAALAAGHAQAQTWNGNGVTNLWSDPLNWSVFRPPIGGFGTTLTFTGNRQLATQQNLASVFDLNAMTFASGAGAFSISGNTVRFLGFASLVQNSVNAVVIASQVQVADRLVVSGAGDISFKGGLANGGPGLPVLALQGSGRLTMTEAASFSGRVEVDSGVLRLEHALALQSAHVALNADNALQLAAGPTARLRLLTGSGDLALGATRLTLGGTSNTSLRYDGGLSATTGGLTISGGGTAQFTGRSSIDAVQVLDGCLLLSGGSLQLNNRDQGLHVGNGLTPTAGAPTLDVTGGATLSSRGRTVQIDGGVGTELRVLETGSTLHTGFQTLVGNHANGRLVVTGGTVAAGSFLAMGFNNASVGALDIGLGGLVTNTVGLLGTLTGATGSAQVSGAGARWENAQLGLGGFSTAQNGGTGSLLVSNGGLVTVSDALTFWTAASRITLDGGHLRVGRLLAEPGRGGTIDLQGDGPLGVAMTILGTGDASFSGMLTGSGTLYKTGAAAQTLASANPFSGNTAIDGGRIVLGHAQALQNSTVQLAVDGGLDLNGHADVTLGGLSGNGSLSLGSTLLRIGNNGRATTYGGVLAGATGTLVKLGSGTTTLTGTGSTLKMLVSEAGSLVLQGGSLTLGDPGAGSAATALAVVGGGALHILGGAQVRANQPGASSVFVDGVAGTQLLIDGAGSRLDAGFQFIAGNSGLGTVTVRNGGALAAGFAGGSRGNLTVESGGTASAAAVALGTLAGSVGEALVTGAGSQLLVSSTLGIGGFSGAQTGGTGTLTLADGGSARADVTHLWTAGSSVRIDGGVLTTAGLSSQGAVGEVALLADPLSGSALVLDGASGVHSFAGRITGDGSLRKTGAATQLLTGTNSFAGSVQVLGGTLQMASGAASDYTVASGALLQLGARNLGGAVVQADAGGRVQYTGTTLTGGLLMGSGAHDISGVRRLVGLQVANGVTLLPRDGATFVGLTNAGLVNNGPGRLLNWQGGGITTGALQVAGTTAVSGFSSTGRIDVLAGGTLGNEGSDLVLGGGSRTRVGAADAPGGEILLAPGTTLQLNGGLLVNNGRIAGPLVVNFGGVAKGAGQFGAVTVTDGGSFSPGNSPGTARTGSATWAAGGSYLVELAAATGTAGTDWDLWAIDGGLDITAGTSANSRFTISLVSLVSQDSAGALSPLAGFDPLRGHRWLIADTTLGITGFDTARFTLDSRGFANATAGGSFSLAVSDGDLYLNFAPVPEPGTWALMLGGLAGLAGLARRRVALTRAGA